MKFKTLLISGLATVALLTGCWQKSVHPFYNESDVIFDPALVGTWKEKKENPADGMTWRIEKAAGNSVYQITIGEEKDDDKLHYDARLFKMDGARFLDLYSRQRTTGEIPAHHLFRVLAIGEKFQIQLLNVEWVARHVRANPHEIAHVHAPDPDHPNDADKAEPILTASTDALQKFVRAHINDEKFWTDSGQFEKIK